MINKKVTYDCDHCGIEVIKYKSTYEKSKGKHYCGKDCYWAYNRGKNHYKYAASNIQCDYCEEPIEVNQWLMNNFEHHFCNRKCQSKYMRKFGPSGENSCMWKGGRTPLYECIRGSAQYLEWRKGVYQRDKYKCVKCGDTTSGNLNAHHIKEFIKIMLNNNISTLEEALECIEFWDLDNGETLCVSCHKKEHCIKLKIVA